MDDGEIIKLYFRRDEAAIRETETKYGAACRGVAMNILGLRQDAEECVNDTWHAAWKRIPPVIPASLRAFLGKITRDLAISRYRANRAKKRFDGAQALLSELEECVPAGESAEAAVERGELAEIISRWLCSLPGDDRALFVRRYWYGDRVKELAKACGSTPNQMARRMRKLREGLQKALEAEGVVL